MADLPIFGKMSFLSVSYSVKKKKEINFAKWTKIVYL